MKFTSLVLILSLVVSSFASASAICANNVLGDGVVEMYNSPVIELSGFKSQVAKNGIYQCQVTSILPVFLNVQKTILCTKSTGETLTGVTIEGLNAFGQHTATVSLYKNTTKIFMSNCGRAN